MNIKRLNAYKSSKLGINSRRIKDANDGNFDNAINAFESMFNDDTLYQETLIDFAIQKDTDRHGDVIYSFAHPNPMYPLTSGYTTGSDKIDNDLNGYFTAFYEDAIEEYREDYPDIDEQGSDGDEKAWDDAYSYMSECIGVYYDVEIKKYTTQGNAYDDGIDIRFVISDGIVTGRDSANETVMSKTFMKDDIEGIKQFAQEIVDFISNLHFD